MRVVEIEIATTDRPGRVKSFSSLQIASSE